MPCLRLNKTSRSDSPGSRSQGGPRKRPLKLSVMTSQALRAWCGLKFLLTERKDVLLERESVRLQTWSLGCSSFRWFFVPESPVLLPRGSQRCGTLGSGLGSLQGGPSCAPPPPAHTAPSAPWVAKVQKERLDFASEIRSQRTLGFRVRRVLSPPPGSLLQEARCHVARTRRPSEERPVRQGAEASGQ